MAQLFNGDAYIIVYTDSEKIDLSAVTGTRRLALRFNITQTIDTQPNQSDITIFNLSESTRNKITSEGVKIEVYAGYDQLKLIGTGDIKNVNNIKNTVDWATVIKIGDSQNSYQKSRFSKSYSSGVEYKVIIEEISKSFGLSVSNEIEQNLGKTETGLTLDGLSKDVLTELSLQNNFEWFVIDGVLILSDKNAQDKEESILINASTGLLQHPILTERGVQVNVQLNPDLRPKKLITVESISVTINDDKLKDSRNKSANGNYICESVNFQGNNFGGGFETVIKAKRYE